jgi:hypothetical protein
MKIIGIVAGLVLMGSVAQADTMICSKGILSIGDSKYDTFNKCGEPAMKDVYQVPVGRGSATVTVEEWTYDFGPTQFVYIVHLQEGKVARIESTRTKGTAR